MEASAAMLQGAELVKIRPDRARLWTKYRKAVEPYTARVLSEECDAIDAFSGMLQTLYDGSSIEGIPKLLFDLALLWQGQGRLIGRKEFPSWSWAGWTVRVHWFDAEPWADSPAEHNSEAVAIMA